jgi:hypothetical protein
MMQCTSAGLRDRDTDSFNPVLTARDERQYGSERTVMTGHRGSRIGRNRERWVVSGLWSASVVIVVAGFVLRAFGSFLHRPDMRLAGVVFIACGVVVAVLGWFVEKFMGNRPSNRA